jgi:hypothetical protein
VLDALRGGDAMTQLKSVWLVEIGINGENWILDQRAPFEDKGAAEHYVTRSNGWMADTTPSIEYRMVRFVRFEEEL